MSVCVCVCACVRVSVCVSVYVCVCSTYYAKSFYVTGEKYIWTLGCHIFMKVVSSKMRPRNEGRIIKDLNKCCCVCADCTYISGSECGRVAVSVECGLSDRRYKLSVIYWLTAQLVVSRVSFFFKRFIAQKV